MGKSKIECKKLDYLTGTQKCVFCHTTDLDEMKYGPIYMHKNIITHYYCLLLSSNMEQNGRDSDGILGFFPNDITKEVRRGMRLYCSFCRSGGATLGCAIPKCKVVFHLPCGMKHGTLHQFFGEFKSFCAKHRPVQRISEKILAESSKGADCGICYESVVPRPIHDTLWAPCCQKSAFFHRECVQRLATSAGYFFKCPLCNNVNTFQQAMKEFGIYIPEQDASWECVPHAYQDLLVRHDTCDSSNCICPSGRKTNVQGTRWELILCKFCGSQGIHIGCGRLKWKCPEFECDICARSNAEIPEGNVRNYNGNRHRLSGASRTADIHPSVSADREKEASDSSDDSSHCTISNRRKKVASPRPSAESRTITPPPSKKSSHDRIEKKSTSNTIVIDDSDDDLEVVCETRGNSSLIKASDGKMIPVVMVPSSSGPKRPRAGGDVNIVPDEIVDITIQMPVPAKKPKEELPPPIKELVFSMPPPQPSTSTAYSSPSTSFAPTDLSSYVLVDPSTFRPEDLPAGTMLFRSLQPMVSSANGFVPQPQVQPQVQPQMQPQMQPQIQTYQPQIQSQLPMQQLGSAGHADAKYSNLCKHRPRCSNHHSPYHLQDHTKGGTFQHNSVGRRRRRRPLNGECDNNRLIPRVLLSPLKYRISNDGHVEILLPRKALFSTSKFELSSMKRKASPLPSKPMKKIKLSKSVDEISLKLQKKAHKNKKRGTRQKGKEKINITVQTHKNLKQTNDTKKDTHSKFSITNFFFPVKVNPTRMKSEETSTNRGKVKKRKRKENKEVTHSKKTEVKLSKESTPGNNPSSKRKYKKKSPCLTEDLKCRKIEDYLQKKEEKSIQPKQDLEEIATKIDDYLQKSEEKSIQVKQDLKEINTERLDENSLKYIIIKDLLDDLIESIIQESHVYKTTTFIDSFEEIHESKIENGKNCDTCSEDSGYNFISDDELIGGPNYLLQKNTSDSTVSMDISGESETGKIENVEEQSIITETMKDVDIAKMLALTHNEFIPSDSVEKSAELCPNVASMQNQITLQSNSLQVEFEHEDRNYKANMIHQALSLPKNTNKNFGNPILGLFPKIIALRSKKRNINQFSSSSKHKKPHRPSKITTMGMNSDKYRKSSVSTISKMSIINSYFAPIQKNKNISDTSKSLSNHVFSTEDTTYLRTDIVQGEDSFQELSLMIGNRNKSNSPDKRPLVELQLNSIANLC